VGAIAVGDLVKSTLGPKGMDKILQSISGRNGDVTVTNDGATILKSIALDNPAAKVLVNLSKVQDDEVGDGTTSVCVLAAELLREAERLIEQNRLHPQLIIEGYREAARVARAALEASARDNSSDAALFREDLLNIARTTLSSKILSQDKEHFAQLAVNAVLRLRGSTNLDHIQVIKKVGGRLVDSYLDEGFILDKRPNPLGPVRLSPAKILLANTSMDTDKVKIFGSRIRATSTEQLGELERAERNKMKEKVEAIKAHGVNCFVNRQLIYDWPEQLFADSGIMAIEHADFDGIERLALVTGGQIVSTFENPDGVLLGECEAIEQIMIGEDRLIKFSGVKSGEACSVVLRGGTLQLLGEAERSLHDAFCVLSQTVKEPKTVLGGGCAEMLMSRAVDDLVTKTNGKKALAVEAFARALRSLPTTLADNGGYDSSDLIAQLRTLHALASTTPCNMGIDMYRGQVADVSALGITESLKLKRQVLMSAAEAAEMIIRVDDIIRCAPRQRREE
jgi:T-complex protein 1 subunit beta